MHFENDTDLYRVIGANHYRKQAKLAQVQLAERAKISISYLSKSKLPAVTRVFLYLYLIRLQMCLVLRLTNYLRRYPNHETYRSANKNRKTCLYSI